MMSSKNKRDFKNIIKNVIETDKFKELKDEFRHGSTRYEHSLRVAKITYRCTKALKLDYKSATKAALLHDFYFDSDFGGLSMNKLLTHASIALKNAKTTYDLNKKEENIIASHMFPLCLVSPKYIESWIVSTIDKFVALYEGYRFNLSLIFSVWTIFLFNMLTIQR